MRDAYHDQVSSSSSGIDNSALHFNDEPLEKHFEIAEELGNGQFAVVRRVINRSTGEQFAAKFIKKRRYATSRRGVTRCNIEREIDVLRVVGGYEYTIKLFEVYETTSDVILILELVSGGELFDYVSAKECLGETEAAAFIQQILFAIKHLHDNHIVHLDIKPENVMLRKRGESKIKLIDFGLSRRILPGTVVKDMIGTPEFVAPEVVNYEPLSTATDMWALGVVTYILLSGGSPFLGETRDETFVNISAVNYHFSERYFEHISPYAKDFISHLFIRDQRKRATVDECLRHPWIRGPDGLVNDVRQYSMISMAQIRSFKIRLRWRRAVDIVIACNRMTADARSTIQKALEAGRSVSSRFDPEELIVSAMLIACEEGNLAGLDQLAVLHRINLNIANRMGETAMHVAAGAGQFDVVHYLHMKGAALDVPDRRGDTPLFWATRNGRTNIVSYIINEENVNINAVNKHNETALHIASWHGYAALLGILCKFNPPLHLKNQDGETALHCAAARGHAECVQSLLDAGTPVDATDQSGQTALHLALRRSQIDIALLLLTKGCKLDVQDENGDTALHIASRIGLLSVVQTLCHLGALVDIVNQNSLTPLHLAAKEGHIEIVRCLCFFGANVLRKNKDGLTAEIIALAQEHTQIGTLLAKMKLDQTRDTYVEQLCPLEMPLRRIKLKVFGHCGVGKTRLICSLQCGSMIGSIIGAVQRRFSDNPSPSSSTTTSNPSQDEGINSFDDSVESNNNMKGNRRRTVPHVQYTRGIDVQNVTLQGCGEFSVWEFGGYEPYHMAYDHFVGNTDCVHVIVYRCTDPTEIQYKQVLYWMNFLKGRVTPSEPIGHCGIISRRSKVIIIGSHATPALFPQRNSDGDYISSDGDAMLKTIRLRFETHFDIHDQLILLNSTQNNCPGMKSLKAYLSKARESILSRLQKPLGLLDMTVQYIVGIRKQHTFFPVITWPHFTNLVRNEVNSLAGDNHCRQLIQQLQLIGEVVYLRDEVSELDYVVLSPEWLGTHVLGNLLSAEFLSQCHMNGCYSIDDFAPIYPEIADPADLLRILDTLQLCAPTDSDGEAEFEFPAFNILNPPKDIWQRDRLTYVYGGVRVLPMRGMERSLQSTFPRIQVALRRSMHDFQDPMDADLMQWNGCSKMSSGQMEALVRLHGDAVEIQVRGPSEISTSCFYFLEDITNLVEQTAQEVAPGISLERHFLSPKHLREHLVNPAVYAPETIMAMQQAESLTIRNNQEGDELFTDVVCFGSRDVAAVLTLGIDVGVAQLQLASRCELAALLDPSDAMGRDWSILAVKLNLTDQLPEVDSTGQSLSRTDQLLAEWALQCPETATVGRLCTVLEELGRQDARDALYRTVPLYLFAPIDEQPVAHLTEYGDSGVVSSTQSTIDPCSASNLSR
ncbi:CAMK/DAPK/DAPK protein kinase, variant [Loa loa]|uniref:CAMK/DAPK/DAPK protein kinase, variant n=1 Tax=Loa loa TaxID=7209 RepID=A0A1S0UEZ7_LOALO|nr:CAMK/DAPK/DAPK protein kinase, variant [Loa loa]EJD74145.1 CAMK/DAPK/DAPK protein kinase, variant [Loa loa]